MQAFRSFSSAMSRSRTGVIRACFLANEACATPRWKALASPPIDAEVGREFGRLVTVADFSDVFCDAEACPVKKNGHVVYRDTNHLTATYAATFAPQITQLMQRLGNELPTLLH